MDQIIFDDAGVQLRSNKLIIKSNIFFMPPLQIFYQSIVNIQLAPRNSNFIDNTLFMSYYFLNGIKGSKQHIILSTRNLQLATFNCEQPQTVYDTIHQQLKQCKTFNLKYKDQVKHLLHVMKGLPKLDFRRVK